MRDQYSSRRRYERRLRIHYRKKLWTTGIITLVVGLVLGFVCCTVAVNKLPRVSDLLGIGPKSDAVSTELTVEPEGTPDTSEDDAFAAEMFAAGGFVEDDDDNPFADDFDDGFADESEEQTLGLAALAGEDTPVVTEEPTAEPTPEPTAEPTAEPTPEPTAEPTAESTDVPQLAIIQSASLTDDNAEVASATEEPTAEPTTEATVEATVEPTVAATTEATVEATAEVAATEAVTEAPTATAEPTPEPTKAPEIVPYGEAVTFTTEITSDGRRHSGDADGAVYETVSLTMKVTDYKDFDYFEENYGDTYDLKGGTAAVELEMTLNDYAGQATIIPQNFLLITFRGADDTQTLQGYQLLDREIAGKIDVELISGETTTLYKRYPFSEMGEMQYMVVTATNGGEDTVYWFEIHAPETEESEDAESAADDSDALTIGSEGDDVKKLQAKLIEKKLLTGVPDGKFGKYTAEAVKILQKQYGMEQTGIADAEFLEKLYSEE